MGIYINGEVKIKVGATSQLHCESIVQVMFCAAQ